MVTYLNRKNSSFGELCISRDLQRFDSISQELDEASTLKFCVQHKQRSSDSDIKLKENRLYRILHCDASTDIQESCNSSNQNSLEEGACRDIQYLCTRYLHLILSNESLIIEQSPLVKRYFLESLSLLEGHILKLHFSSTQEESLHYRIIQVMFEFLLLELLACHSENTLYLSNETTLWSLLMSLLNLSHHTVLVQATVIFLESLIQLDSLYKTRLESQPNFSACLTSLLNGGRTLSYDSCSPAYVIHLFCPRLKFINDVIPTENQLNLLTPQLYWSVLHFWNWITPLDNSNSGSCCSSLKKAEEHIDKALKNFPHSHHYYKGQHIKFPTCYCQYRPEITSCESLRALMQSKRMSHYHNDASTLGAYIVFERLEFLTLSDPNNKVLITSLSLLTNEFGAFKGFLGMTRGLCFSASSFLCTAQHSVKDQILPLVFSLLSKSTSILRDTVKEDLNTFYLRVLVKLCDCSISQITLIRDALRLLKCFSHLSEAPLAQTRLPLIVCHSVARFYTQDHPATYDILEDSCAVLTSLLDAREGGTENRKVFMKQPEAVKLWIRILKRWTQCPNISIPFTICAVLCNLTYNNLNAKKLLGKARACEAISQLLKFHSTTGTINKVVIYAFHAIANLSLYEPNIKRFLRCQLADIFPLYLQKIQPTTDWEFMKILWKTLSHLVFELQVAESFVGCTVPLFNSLFVKKTTCKLQNLEAYLWGIEALTCLTRHKSVLRLLETHEPVTKTLALVSQLPRCPFLLTKTVVLLYNFHGSSQIHQFCFSPEFVQFWLYILQYFAYNLEPVKSVESLPAVLPTSRRSRYSMLFKSLYSMNSSITTLDHVQLCTTMGYIRGLVNLSYFITTSPLLSCTIYSLLLKCLALVESSPDFSKQAVEQYNTSTTMGSTPQAFYTLQLNDLDIETITRSIRNLMLLPLYTYSAGFMYEALHLLSFIAHNACNPELFSSISPQTPTNSAKHSTDTLPRALEQLLTKRPTLKKSLRSRFLKPFTTPSSNALDTVDSLNVEKSYSLVEQIFQLWTIHENRKVQQKSLMLLNQLILRASTPQEKESLKNTSFYDLFHEMVYNNDAFLEIGKETFHLYRMRYNDQDNELIQACHIMTESKHFDITAQKTDDVFLPHNLDIFPQSLKTVLNYGGTVHILALRTLNNGWKSKSTALLWKANSSLQYFQWKMGKINIFKPWNCYLIKFCNEILPGYPAEFQSSFNESQILSLSFNDAYSRFNINGFLLAFPNSNECNQFLELFSFWKDAVYYA